MRWVFFVFILVIISILIIVFIARDKNINRDNKISPSTSITTARTIVVEKMGNIEIDVGKPYDVINLEKLGKVCLALLNNKEYSILLEKLSKNECTGAMLRDIEKLLVQALLYKSMKDINKEIEILTNIIKKYKTDEIVVNNEEALLCALLEKSDHNSKYDLVKEYIFARKAFSCFTKELLIKAGDYFYSKKEKDEFSARRLYSKAFFLSDNQEQRNLIKRIEELNKKIIFSPNIYPDSFIYTVVKGDTLLKIGKRFFMTPELIKIINKLPSDLIYPGKDLKILKVDDDKKLKVVVKKSINKLYILWGDDIVKEYVISAGHPDISPTPEGTFTITSRLVHPAWKGVPYGDPKNILGTRWLGFNEPFNNYGIHGTTQPETIGQNVTNGCIRMLNQDVEELFDFLTEGVEVTVEK